MTRATELFFGVAKLPPVGASPELLKYGAKAAGGRGWCVRVFSRAGPTLDEKDDRRDGIERLFRKYGKGVGSYVYARLGDADLAESITSAVFLVVVRRFEQCRSSPAGWIWSIVRSELARHFRDRRPADPLD